MDRKKYNNVFIVLGMIVAVISLLIGLGSYFHFLPSFISDSKTIGAVLIGIWTLFPPIFFWVDWVIFSGELDAEAKDVAKHTHDLSRNIWLAFAAILIFLFGIPFTPTGAAPERTTCPYTAPPAEPSMR